MTSDITRFAVPDPPPPAGGTEEDAAQTPGAAPAANSMTAAPPAQSMPLYLQHKPIAKPSLYNAGYLAMLGIRYFPRGFFSTLADWATFKKDQPIFRFNKKVGDTFKTLSKLHEAHGGTSETFEKEARYELEKFGIHEKFGDFTSPIKERSKKDFSEAFYQKRRESFYEHAFDNTLGALNLGFTVQHIRRTRKDITRMYADAIAYESGKPAGNIDFDDIKNSDNTIVQNAVNRHRALNSRRLAADALFFGRCLGYIPLKFLQPLRNFEFGEMALGAKAILVFNDFMRREPTFFEHLSDLVNRKMMPEQGIGDPITTGEIIDLYQHYAKNIDPGAMFKDVSLKQQGDRMDWEQAEKIFSRIADLMNHSYKYKHRVELDTQYQADFDLPKLIYLMGHGMIDPHKPKETLAYVESFNRYGIEAVTSLHAVLERGMPLEQALEKYPVDLSLLENGNRAAGTDALSATGGKSPLPAPSTAITDATPTTPLHEIPGQLGYV